MAQSVTTSAMPKKSAESAKLATSPVRKDRTIVKRGPLGKPQ